MRRCAVTRRANVGGQSPSPQPRNVVTDRVTVDCVTTR